MKLAEASVRYPVSVAVGVILVVMFGVLALLAVPVQLTPDVERPTITVETQWPGASPQEVEREIIDRQEKRLKSIEGLHRMTSEAQNNLARVTLEFRLGTNTDNALLRVNNQLQQVTRYPPRAERPVLFSASQQARPIAWMTITPIRKLPHHIEHFRTFVDERVLPLIERVPGVALSNLYGGRDTEMQVVVDPKKVAAHSLTMLQISAALQRENRDLSAGGFEEGKRRYAVRTKARIEEPADADQVVVAYRGGAPVRISDLGFARIGYAPTSVVVRTFGQTCLVLNAIRETGANVIEVMAGLKKGIARINQDLLKAKGLFLQLVYDETEYIEQAIDLVVNNIFVGGSLAVLVLLLFLRSISTTFIIAVAIPISLVGTFIMMSAFGRNINVISLAGLAFASGMVVDNSIVVLENIFRRHQEGESRRQAAVAGTSQVWGAVLASTLTTVAVFLPVLRIQEEAGQLFADIAIAVSFAVLISLAVSITVIPSLSARLVGEGAAGSGRLSRLADRLGGLVALGGAIQHWVVEAVRWLMGRTTMRLAVVVLFTLASLGMAWGLSPKAEYLPTGNRNLILGILIPPAGYNTHQMSLIGGKLTREWRGHWGAKPGQAQGATAQPSVRNFFYVAFEGRIFMGLVAHDPSRARELIPVMRRSLGQVPGMIPIVQQTSLFERGVGRGRSIDLDLTGPSLERLVSLGQEMFGRIRAVLPGAQVQPIPSLELGYPEVRFVPDRVRAAAVGMSASEIGFNLDVLVEGAKVDEVNRQGLNLDLVLISAAQAVDRTQDLGRMQINTPQGRLVTLESLAPSFLVAGPSQINHIERQRAITLRVIPSRQIALQEAMERIRDRVIAPLHKSGRLKAPDEANLSGTADDLQRTAAALRGNFLLALAITFLLMAALFESFLYPLVVMFSVPLAAAGGFWGLWLVNRLITSQALDVLTMLGFVILIGIVVNNAILIVHQTLGGMRDEKLGMAEAIAQAVRLRIRPIFMSTLTSVFAMLPLVLFPGPGSELYRGLGSVVVGGLLVSTVFTLFLVPCLLSLVLQARAWLSARLGQEFKA